MTEREGVRGLWITGLPSDELERDLEAWRRAASIIDGLAQAFIPVRGNDAALCALVDAKARAMMQAKFIEEGGIGDAAGCVLAGCARPTTGEDEVPMCRKHRHELAAREEVQQWERARRILEPLVAAAREIGVEELAGVMTQALHEVDVALGHGKENLELAEESEPENGGGRQESCA